jgi:hypothetical protein
VTETVTSTNETIQMMEATMSMSMAPLLPECGFHHGIALATVLVVGRRAAQ